MFIMPDPPAHLFEVMLCMLKKSINIIYNFSGDSKVSKNTRSIKIKTGNVLLYSQKEYSCNIYLV